MNCLPCSRGGQNIGENRPCIPKWLAIASVVTAAALLAVGGLAITSLTPASPPFLTSLTGVVGKGGMIGVAFSTIFFGGSLLAIPFIHINQKQQASSGTKKQEASTSTKGEGNMVRVPEGWTPLHYYASKVDVENINRILNESTEVNPHLIPIKMTVDNEDEGEECVEGDLPIRLFVRELLRESLSRNSNECKYTIESISEEKIAVAKRLSVGVDLEAQFTFFPHGTNSKSKVQSSPLHKAWEALLARIRQE